MIEFYLLFIWTDLEKQLKKTNDMAMRLCVQNSYGFYVLKENYELILNFHSGHIYNMVIDTSLGLLLLVTISVSTIWEHEN